MTDDPRTLGILTMRRHGCNTQNYHETVRIEEPHYVRRSRLRLQHARLFIHSIELRGGAPIPTRRWKRFGKGVVVVVVVVEGLYAACTSSHLGL
jgi:hypothetical protein